MSSEDQDDEGSGRVVVYLEDEDFKDVDRDFQFPYPITVKVESLDGEGEKSENEVFSLENDVEKDNHEETTQAINSSNIDSSLESKPQDIQGDQSEASKEDKLSQQENRQKTRQHGSKINESDRTSTSQNLENSQYDQNRVDSKDKAMDRSNDSPQAKTVNQSKDSQQDKTIDQSNDSQQDKTSRDKTVDQSNESSQDQTVDQSNESSQDQTVDQSNESSQDQTVDPSNESSQDKTVDSTNDSPQDKTVDLSNDSQDSGAQLHLEYDDDESQVEYLEEDSLQKELIDTLQDDYEVEFLEEDMFEMNVDDIIYSSLKENHRLRQKPGEFISVADDIRSENPGISTDKLAQKLAEIMRQTRPPTPPPGYCSLVTKGDTSFYQCSFCGKKRSTIPLAARHYQFSHGTYYLSCLACGHRYRNTTNLYKHEKVCSSPDGRLVLRARGLYLGRKGRGRPYTTNNDFITYRTRKIKNNRGQRLYCSKCPATFAHIENLKAHEYSHDGLRPYACSDCPARYTSVPALRRHKRAAHGTDRFICDHCDAVFSIKSLLVSHMNTHNAIRRFPCLYCDRRFAQKMALRHHTNKVHFNLPPQHCCPLCPKRYARMTQVKQHMSVVHNMNLITRRMFYQALPTLPEEVLKSTISPSVVNFKQEIEEDKPLIGPELSVQLDLTNKNSPLLISEKKPKRDKFNRKPIQRVVPDTVSSQNINRLVVEQHPFDGAVFKEEIVIVKDENDTNDTMDENESEETPKYRLVLDNVPIEIEIARQVKPEHNFRPGPPEVQYVSEEYFEKMKRKMEVDEPVGSKKFKHWELSHTTIDVDSEKGGKKSEKDEVIAGLLQYMKYRRVPRK